jgi:hypothetical protein
VTDVTAKKLSNNLTNDWAYRIIKAVSSYAKA